MIPNYAYWGLPNYMKYVNTPGYYPPQNIPMNKKSTNNEKRIPYSSNSTEKNSSPNFTNENNSEPLLTVFGINFYFDDILIICLLFFLYNENVSDTSLFLVFIILLLS